MLAYYEFHFEHHMKQKLRSDARLLPLKKAIPIGTLKEGYSERDKWGQH